MIKPLQPGFRPRENHTTALRASEMHSPFGGWRHMNKPLWGLRVDGPLGRRFLRGLSLTAAMPLRVVVGASKL